MRRLWCAFAIALAALAAGCARPADEAWLRFLGFRAADCTDAAGASGGCEDHLAVLWGSLRNGRTDSADALLENRSTIVGGEGGIGILVHRVLVEYRLPGLALPADDYALTLYLPPPSGEEASTGRLSGLPVVPRSVKSRLVQAGAFDDLGANPTVRLEVHVTFLARTDDGLELDTTGALTVMLVNR